jgi:hypothetical protein
MWATQLAHQNCSAGARIIAGRKESFIDALHRTIARIGGAMPGQHTDNALNVLVGSRLSGVAFVMDYVQCDFDTAKLTAYTVPSVKVDERAWSRTDAGWRDALCERIGIAVRRVVRSDEQLSIDFEDNSTIVVSLRDCDYVGPEAFMLSSADHPIVVG